MKKNKAEILHEILSRPEFVRASGYIKEILAKWILLLWEIRGENEHNVICRTGEFALIEALYVGQVVDLECPICKRKQCKVDRVTFELGKRHLLHPHTCGGNNCPSHTEMEMIKS